MMCFDCEQVASLQAAYRHVLAEAQFLQIARQYDRSAVCDIVARTVLESVDGEDFGLNDLVSEALDRLRNLFVVEELAEAA